MQDKTDRIRQRAHAIWVEEGHPEGQAERHWTRAEQEFADDEAAAAITPATAKKSATPATTRKRKQAAPSVGEAPEFETPKDPPVAPDVEAITDPARAPKPIVAKKPGRRPKA